MKKKLCKDARHKTVLKVKIFHQHYIVILSMRLIWQRLYKPILFNLQVITNYFKV